MVQMMTGDSKCRNRHGIHPKGRNIYNIKFRFRTMNNKSYLGKYIITYWRTTKAYIQITCKLKHNSNKTKENHVKEM